MEVGWRLRHELGNLTDLSELTDPPDFFLGAELGFGVPRKSLINLIS